MAKRINLDHLHEALKPLLERYQAMLFPEAKKESKGFRIGNTAGDKGTSLWFSEGGFNDHATGEKGSLIRLASLKWGCSIREAAERLAKEFGINIEEDKASNTVAPKNRVLVDLNEIHTKKVVDRGLNPNMAAEMGVFSCTDGTMALVHYTGGHGQIAGIKYVSSTGQWFSEIGSCHVLWPMDYVTNHFPDGDTLYITEGHWDAWAGCQAGFPTLSVPNGAGNLQWIEECFNLIHSYSTIVLCFDNDAPGITGLTNAVARLSKGVQVVQYPEGCKDLNDVLAKKGIDTLKEIMTNTVDYSPENVINACNLKDQAKEQEQYAFQHETPFGKSFPFAFRPREYTVYTAYTGHGKTEILRQIILHISQTYAEKIFVAGFEDTPIQQTRAMIRQLGNGVPDEIVDQILKNISFYDTSQIDKAKKISRIKVKDLIELFTYQYKRYGYTHFIVDNLMTLDIDRQDNTAQAEAANDFRQFVISHPVHLHLVAHPRKAPPNTGKLEPPNPSEIRGASEIADMAWNIFSLIRNIPKEREIDKMRIEHVAQERINTIYRQKPDCIVHIQKQRATGVLPTLYLWFDPVTKSFKTQP